jgi:hypothetical protein
MINPRGTTFTLCYSEAKQSIKWVGQVEAQPGERSARMTYILPASATSLPGMLNLLDELAEHTGDRGALNLLAELDESSPALDLFRRAGFAIYAWQRIWKLATPEKQPDSSAILWRQARGLDDISVRNLFQSLVPPLFQAADCLQPRRFPGLVYMQGDEILAYIECHYGRSGILLLPLIHPEVKDVGKLMNAIPFALDPLFNRPVFLAVRSYQAWLETTLNNMGAVSSERQALLVKRLAVAQRVVVPVRSVLAEHRRAETSIPVVNQISQTPQNQQDGRSEIS